MAVHCITSPRKRAFYQSNAQSQFGLGVRWSTKVKQTDYVVNGPLDLLIVAVRSHGMLLRLIAGVLSMDFTESVSHKFLDLSDLK
jgi:hypothetical protein